MNVQNEINDSYDEVKKQWLVRCINLLARREHSLVEMVQKLTQKGCPDEIAIAVSTECMEKDYLSLERFAGSFANNRANLGYGPINVRYLLQQHEIPNDAIEEAIRETDWLEAKSRAVRKIGDRAPLQLKQALYRRGFSE